jgi:hypothetical protein
MESFYLHRQVLKKNFLQLRSGVPHSRGGHREEQEDV